MWQKNFVIMFMIAMFGPATIKDVLMEFVRVVIHQNVLQKIKKM